MPSITWDNAWELSSTQREKLIKNINKRLKEKSGDPSKGFFND